MDYIKAIKYALAAVGGTVVHWLGGFDHLLTALLALIVLDYVSGVGKAVHNHTLSSNIGLKGIIRKMMILGVVSLAFVMQNLMQDAVPLREISIMFFIANEGISVLENAAEIGLPLPDKLRSVLEQVAEKRKG